MVWSQTLVRHYIHNVKQHIFILKATGFNNLSKMGAKSETAEAIMISKTDKTSKSRTIKKKHERLDELLFRSSF